MSNAARHPVDYRICLCVVLTVAWFNCGKAVGQPSRKSRAGLEVFSYGLLPWKEYRPPSMRNKKL